eukprot:c6074_g1_i1 orf=716-1903(-)
MLSGEHVDVPLPLLFEEAQRFHSRASESQLESDDIGKGRKILEQCMAMIEKLGLFSANEGIEDIATSDLKYLLVSYYLAELTEKTLSSDRLQIIKVTQSHLKVFISTCERLELVPDAELLLLTEEGTPSSDVRRTAKIARFKRVKAAEIRLQEIKEMKERRRRSMQASVKSHAVEHGEEDVLDEFGEEEREAWITQISLFLCKALDLLETLKREEEVISVRGNQDDHELLTKEMLEQRASRAEAWHREASTRAKTSKPPQPITCATFAQDVIEGRASISDGHHHTHGPFVFGPASLVSGPILTERQKMAAEVFQPSHRLPTMSIEEAGLREMEIMKNWTERNAKLAEEANSSWTNDSKRGNDSDDEAAENKARAWDDWKDDNPRGAGNKKLTPCG